MKKRPVFILIILLLILTGCQNIPHDPTKTPTMNAAQMEEAIQQTLEISGMQTETQLALENPTETPTFIPTESPTIAPPTAVPAMAMPPTATKESLPYYRIGNKSSLIYAVGSSPVNTWDFYPAEYLYIEVCYRNEGSGIWDTGYSVIVTNNDSNNTSPGQVFLGEQKGNGETACFSFNQAAAGPALGVHTSTFALTNGSGTILKDGYISVSWNVN